MIQKLQDFNKIVSDFIKMIEEGAEKDVMSKIKITEDIYFLEGIKDSAEQLKRAGDELNESLIKKIKRQFEELTPDEWEDFGKKVMAEVDELASSAIKVEETAIPAQEGAAASPLENKLNEGQIDLLETSLLPANKKLSQDAIDIINSFLACPPLYHVYLNRLEKEMRLFLNSSRDITTYADRYIKQEVEQGRNKITMYYCALSRDLLISALLLKAYRKADGGVLAIEDVKSKLHEDYHYEDSFYGLLPETGLKSIRKENKIPTELAKTINSPISHISTTLKELEEKGLIECLTSERRKNKFFRILLEKVFLKNLHKI